MSSVRVRMAPSPTGWIHIGTARSFLFDYFMAQQQQDGVLILRIEDTDQKRSVPGGTQGIIDGLNLLGITYQEGPEVGGEYGPYIQTERKEIYEEFTKKLLDEGNAYYCFCSAERLEKLREEQKVTKQKLGYDGLCSHISIDEASSRVAAGEPHVVRMKVPDTGKIEFDDTVYGHIAIDVSEVDDQVIVKTDGIPTYHWAVVVDDLLMKVTHVVRGSEWISSTPKQVLLYQYLGALAPTFVHVPLVLNASGKGKLSKRKGNVAVSDFFRAGYIREGVINFISLIGWNPDPKIAKQDEIYDVEFLIKNFDPHRIKKSPGRFDVDKLTAINATWIAKLSKEELYERAVLWIKLIQEDSVVDKVRGVTDDLQMWRERVAKLENYFIADKNRAIEFVGIVQQRIKKLNDIYDWAAPLLGDDVGFDTESIAQVLPDVAKRTEIIYNLREALEKLPTWDQENWEPAIRALAEKHAMKAGDLFMVLRIIVVGKRISPPLREFMVLAGREFVFGRFEKLLQLNF